MRSRAHPRWSSRRWRQSAHADIEITSAGATACTLAGLPEITILRADGAALPIQQQPGAHLTLGAITLGAITLGAHWGTGLLTLFWSNWCHAQPGSLDIAMRLPDASDTLRGPFNGPPDYDYVPDCLAPGKPSTVQVLQAYGHA